MNGVSKLVSVVIPIYNTEKDLERCIVSVLSQTYKDIEIILVNDGSTDSSCSICKKYAEQDSRIVLVDKENGGVSDARNVGIEMAKGDFISFIDSDDFINAHYIESLYSALIQNDADISMSNYYIYHSEDSLEKGNKYADDECKNIISGVDAISYILDSKAHVNYVVLWNKLFRKSLFDGIKFPSGRINEDVFTTYKLFFNAHKIVYLNELLYYYVRRKGSIMNSSFTLKNYDAIEADKELCDFCIAHRICIPKATKKYLYDYWRFIYEYGRNNKNESTNIMQFKKDFYAVYKERRVLLSWIDRCKLGVYICFPRAYSWCIKRRAH